MKGMSYLPSQKQRPGLGDRVASGSIFPGVRIGVRKWVVAAAIFVGSVFSASAVEVREIADIGPHQPILRVRKNVNPQNVMVVYTKMDASGRFLEDRDLNRPVLDFYWLMEGKTYKPVNGLIKAEIRKRFVPRWTSKGLATRFIITMSDLKEVKSDISEPHVDVYAREDGGAPDVEAQMSLGPSDGNMRIKLSSIQTEGRAFPPAVYSVTLKGEEVVAGGQATGKKVARKYASK